MLTRLCKYAPEGDYESWDRLTASEAKKLEKSLENHPDVLDDRLQLIAYYERRQDKKSPSALKAFAMHLGWLIDNHPKHYQHSASMVRYKDQSYSRLKSRWMRKVRESGDDVTILCHAAHFCFLHQAEVQRKLLLQASSLDPQNEEIRYSLANCCKALAYDSTGIKARRYAKEAFEQIRCAIQIYSQNPTPHTSLSHSFEYVIHDVAVLLLGHGLLDYVEELAQIALNRPSIEERRNMLLEPEHKRSFTCRRAQRLGYALLGHVALARGDVQRAKERLYHMINVPSRTGLDYTLANELLKKKEVACVLDLLNHDLSSCQSASTDNFDCSRGDDIDQRKLQLRSWIERIQSGKRPKLY